MAATGWEAKLFAPDGAADDRFGVSISASADGTRVLIGDDLDDSAGGLDTGSAHVFLRRDAVWTHEATLLAPGGGAGDRFGNSVSMSSDGSRALIGAIFDDTGHGADAGSAHVFVRSGTSWALEATLLAPDGDTDDRFGERVSLRADGTRALIGAVFDDTLGDNAGSAHVFVRSGMTWTHEATLFAPDGQVGDALGHGVSLSADGMYALVAGRFDAGGSGAGSAHVFVRNGTTWSHEARLVAPDGAADDWFGETVSLSGDGARALVGAIYDDSSDGLENVGSAHVYVRSGTNWTHEATLLAPAGAADDRFGGSASLSGDGMRALVGAAGVDTAVADTGSAHLFVRSGTIWTHHTTLLAPDGASGDRFGGWVSLSGDGTRAFVGAWEDDTAGGVDAGSAHVFVVGK